MESRIYKNLNNGMWSIKQRIEGKWMVVGHCESCVVEYAVPYVSEKARQRLLPKQQREVHAWITAELIEVEGFVSFRGRRAGVAIARHFDCAPEREVTYHPFEREDFYYKDNSERFRTAARAWFDTDAKMRACL